MLPVHFLKWCRPAKKLSQTTVVTLLSHFWQAGLWCGSGSAFIAKLKNNNNKNARKFITNNYFVNLYQLDVFFYFWAIFCVFWNCWEATSESLKNDTAVFLNRNRIDRAAGSGSAKNELGSTVPDTDSPTLGLKRSNRAEGSVFLVFYTSHKNPPV